MLRIATLIVATTLTLPATALACGMRPIPPQIAEAEPVEADDAEEPRAPTLAQLFADIDAPEAAETPKADPDAELNAEAAEPAEDPQS